MFWKCDNEGMKDAEKTIGAIIDFQPIAFIGSVDADGFPNMKAMLRPRKRNGIKEIWFSTNTSSNRVGQYRKNKKACVYFYDKRFFRGVQLIGTMEVLEDKMTKEMIWRDGDTQYYSKGVTDPDYCVLKFTAVNGRYYHSFKSEDFEVQQSNVLSVKFFGKPFFANGRFEICFSFHRFFFCIKLFRIDDINWLVHSRVFCTFSASVLFESFIQVVGVAPVKRVITAK